MAPKRKKSKIHLEDPQAQHATETNDPAASTAQQSAALDSRQSTDTSAKASPAPNRSSWTWASKASPIAQIARESISVAQGATTESSESARPPNSVSKSVRGSRKSIPLAAEATKVHATSDASKSRVAAEKKVISTDGSAGGETKELVVEQARLPPDPTSTDGGGKGGESSARNSWLGGWWSRPDDYVSDGEKPNSKKPKLDAAVVDEASSTPLPGGTPTGEGPVVGLKNAENFAGVSDGIGQKQDEGVQPAATTTQPSSRSWFGLWSSTQNQQAAPQETVPTDGQADSVPRIAISTEPPTVETAIEGSEAPTTAATEEKVASGKPSAWAFWSSDKTKDPAPTPGGTQKHIGELAVADTPSQSNPEAAQFKEQRDEHKAKPKRAESLLRPKRGRADKGKDSAGEASPAIRSPADQSPAPSQAPTPSGTPPPAATGLPPPKRSKAEQARPNFILPSFKDTFPPAPNPGYMERLTQYLAHSLHIPGHQAPLEPQHVYIAPSPQRIKKAVAIGVHGFFPGAIIQKVLGQPTGTSVRFANHAAEAIKTWCQQHQPDTNVEVEKVALEGEGYIADRVATLWKLLLNWTSHLQSADAILVACHSQGVPVAIMLVSKLIQLGCLSPNVRVGVCAMAGISLGPFSEYRSRLFGGSALELFEFGDCNSKVSRAYADSLDICLRHGVRVTFVGSIDDQLVSLESSLHAPLSHPYVARAVFIDGRLHAPNFLTHLVVFALKLRNRGVSDHLLLRELSGPLAGSLVGGDGHSRIYDDPDVYRLALEFALESTDVLPLSPSAAAEDADRTSAIRSVASSARRASLSGNLIRSTDIAPKITPYEPTPAGAVANPFFLPFAVRGILEEEIVKRDVKLSEEVQMLIKEFEEWKPTSRVLRDVRWRLEGVKSMG